MADNVDNVDDQVVDDSTSDTDDVDIVVGPEPDKKPDVVTLTPEQFAQLQSQSDTARAVKEGIEGLTSKLYTPQASAPAPVNAPTQTAEEYLAEHGDDLFDKEKAPKIMAEFNKKYAEREFIPVITNLSAQLAATKRELLENRDPMFKKYAPEIEALVRAQPANVQAQPDIYERAWQTVRERHRAEIEEETVNSKVAAAVEAKLKELGIDPTKPTAPARPAAYENSAARSAQSTPNAGKRTIRLPDEATLKKYEAEALRKGLDIKDLLATKGYR